jgi:hemerythrin-like domain-containing protein
VSEGDCFRQFRDFKALASAQLKAEEYVLYSLFEDEERSDKAREYIYKAYEEHDLIDFLLKEMGLAEELSRPWLAKLRLVCELLERHLEGEDQDFLPQARKSLSDDELTGLCARYVQERDQIFKKKSGPKPALATYPVSYNSH